MKRIALGLFMGGMAVCAASAAEVRAVASKGYVDTVVGFLDGLQTRENSSVVSAINELVGRLGSFELSSNKTQTIDASSTATQYPSAKAVYDTAIVPLNNKEDKSNKTQTIDANSTEVEYPSAEAVWGKFDALDYNTAENGETEGLAIGNAYISQLEQIDGKIKATQKIWTKIYDSTTDGGLIRDISTLNGSDGNVPAPARDIVGALMLLRSEISSSDNSKQDKSTEDYQVGMANGTWQTLTPAEKAALQSGVTGDTVRQVATNTSQVATNTEELSKRVKVDQSSENKYRVMVTDETGKIIPAPLAECSDLTSKCVLTYGAEGYGWEVIARGNGN
jgi:hypothetical protein